MTALRVGKTFPFEAGLFGSSQPGGELIALAGLATEIMIVNAGLVTDENGDLVSIGRLLPHLVRSCSDDMMLWANQRVDRTGETSAPEGGWTKRFLREAEELSNHLDPCMTQPIVAALDSAVWLSGAEIESLAGHVIAAGPRGPVADWIKQGFVTVQDR